MIRDDYTDAVIEHPYLKRQIIPYIGNKRRLLPLLLSAFQFVFEKDFKGRLFADLFAGSGIVSRLANLLGFRVYANDWEPYAFILNSAYLTISEKDLSGMFDLYDGIDGILNHLNSLQEPDETEQYITRYFCPCDDQNPDYRNERLFYTRYNGMAIDKIRTEIERLYPEDEVRRDNLRFKEKTLLLALLLHQAATHTNTSGVFKAFHKGFGGHTGDALKRILAHIALPYPVLINFDRPNFVFAEDAVQLVRRKPIAGKRFDIVYIDPPYNQHQYGSNYHLLNSIALWDKPLLNKPSSVQDAGKAAIRSDWVKTRSAYCYRETAFEAFSRLLDSIDSRYIMISYSTEGIIPFDELITRCTERGKVSLFTNEYIKYRGGRQSINRLNNTIEFVVIVDTKSRSFPDDIKNVRRIICGRSLNLQTKMIYSKKQLEKYFIIDQQNERIGFEEARQVLWLQTRGFLKLETNDLFGTIMELDISESDRERMITILIEKLKKAQCRNKVEEIAEIIRALVSSCYNVDYYARLLPITLRKIAHKKYKSQFIVSLAQIYDLKYVYPDAFAGIETKVMDIARLAQRRFAG